MSTEEKLDKELNEVSFGVSRREFLRSAGFVVGGATLGSIALVSACGTTTVTAPGVTSTKTVTNTTTIAGPGGSIITVTQPGGAGSTVTVTQPGGAGSTSTVTAMKTVETGGGVAVEGLTHIIVNGDDYWGVVKPEWTLAYVLREKLALTGTKRGCKSGDCGVCTVLMNGRAVLSCCILAIEADGAKIDTIEGEMKTDGKFTPLQQAFINEDALQCGFCTPGMIMTAKALLAFKPKPTLAEIKEFMAGTICRCGANVNIIKAIQKVAG